MESYISTTQIKAIVSTLYIVFTYSVKNIIYDRQTVEQTKKFTEYKISVIIYELLKSTKEQNKREEVDKSNIMSIMNKSIMEMDNEVEDVLQSSNFYFFGDRLL